MLGVKVELLTGRYAATRFNDRSVGEWPPHPARLFSAMVAMWADADEPDHAEREALLWFESLGAPEISASGARPRASVTFFVPNNEASATVVADQSKNFAKLADLGTELAGAHRRLSLDPDDRSAAKDADKLEKAATKLREKVLLDSAKGSASKVSESPDAVRNGIQLLPDERGKQGRAFPVMIPEHPVVHFSWPDAPQDTEHRGALDGLLARVSRLGHSSSLVSCSLIDDVPPPSLVPLESGMTSLRVTAPGLLDELELAFAAHQASEPRVLPMVLASYGEAEEVPLPSPESLFGTDWIVLRDPSPKKLPLARALDLTVAVRGALLSYADDPLPEILSGHQPGPVGERTPASATPHLAVVPLPFVGHVHADGGIRGVAIVVPRAASLFEREAIATAVRRWVEAGDGYAAVAMGRAGVRTLEVDDPLGSLDALSARSWCRASPRWVSCTPVALDRFPGDLWSASPAKRDRAEAHAQESVATACTYIGLPRPASVSVEQSGPVIGVPDVRSFPTYRSPGRKLRRVAVHVRVEFDEPVRGPVLLGAGRYFGYGLLRPVDSRSSALSGGSVQDLIGVEPTVGS